MHVRIAIALDGNIGIFVDDGTYEEAQALAAQLYAAIGLVADLQVLNPPEQHRHAHEDHVHHHPHLHAPNHS
jgi:hypothetical protein